MYVHMIHMYVMASDKVKYFVFNDNSFMRHDIPQLIQWNRKGEVASPNLFIFRIPLTVILTWSHAIAID